MSWNHNFDRRINLHVPNRILKEDADRQQRSAAAILERLHGQPGIILADEVGMGKTFVALAVAVSVALNDPAKRPVVVMIPPSLTEKWPADFKVFQRSCFHDVSTLRYGIAENTLGFLKLLDHSQVKRAQVIFLKHGTFHSGLRVEDGLTKLAFIQRALHRRRDCDDLYKALYKHAGTLLRLGYLDAACPAIWELLLNAPPMQWKKILVKNCGRAGWTEESEDPVPPTLLSRMHSLGSSSFQELFQNLDELLPRRQSAKFEDKLKDLRRISNEIIRGIWKECIQKLNLRLPLLIMDEAHHLKNPGTRLASLFNSQDAEGDAEEVREGMLAGVFERMLFLTATPFQLGHHELCSVLERFEGIAWNSLPQLSRAGYRARITKLHLTLDSMQLAAKRFEEAWARLDEKNLELEGAAVDTETWWQALTNTEDVATDQDIVLRYRALEQRTNAAAEMLQCYVIRHLRNRSLTISGYAINRRERITGRGILDDDKDALLGLGIDQSGALPFLLSARLCALNPDERPVFAEGLSSSYEAFLDTSAKREEALDLDDEATTTLPSATDKKSTWYRNEIESLVRSEISRLPHPKMAATVSRALTLWGQGEKVLIFCHYVATGKALRQAISEALHALVQQQAAKKLKCTVGAVDLELEKLGARFDVKTNPWRQELDNLMDRMLAEYPVLTQHSEDITIIIRRYLKTPSFLLRYFPLANYKREQHVVEKSFASCDSSGQTLSQLVNGFLHFLANQCVEEERQQYILKLKSIQPGSIRSDDIRSSFAGDDDDTKNLLLMPNVRLVNGATNQSTRQTIMRTFNTPFYPDILIASSVMAEGVDLHLACRHIIHHDLCWNPSMLEQRTGRVDRIGSKMEQCARPIQVYLPYIGETQDEKMYRVVTDREKWFNIVMGETYSNDLRTTEKTAARLPLPESIVAALTMDLSV